MVAAVNAITVVMMAVVIKMVMLMLLVFGEIPMHAWEVCGDMCDADCLSVADLGSERD